MKKVFFLISLSLFILNIIAQRPSPVVGVVADGAGIYTGLKLCPQTCDTCAGNFFVSSTNDFQGTAIKWLAVINKPMLVTNVKDGLSNSKALLKWVYLGVDITKNGLASTLAAYPEGLSGVPAGAVEVCFQKNYKDGKLIPATTVDNMWYLPAHKELLQLWTFNYSYKTAFGELFKPESYWSSTEFSNVTALTSDFNYSGALINCFKAASYNVRCIRRNVPPITKVGSKFGGGFAFLVDSTEQHGYVCAATDQSEGICWNTNNEVVTGAVGVALGTGQANTNAIVKAQGKGNYAAQLCNDLILGGFDDWFLPSRDEMDLMYNNLQALGVGDFSAFYWTSTEDSPTFAVYSYFGTGNFYNNFKITPNRVRCIRKF